MRLLAERLLRDPRIEKAWRFFEAAEPDIEAEQIRLTLIPAPPFGEDARATEFGHCLESLRIKPVRDAVGNIVGNYNGPGANPVVLGAHLDTVFPAATPLTLRRTGRTLHLPGISDNGAGLSALLWTLRAARHSGLDFERPVIAIGNVGEEGAGNLRGIRHLFQAPPWEGGRCDFIAIDGGGVQKLIHRALGSRRFRVSMHGPGGHSWADFGRPNPIHAIAEAVTDFTRSAPSVASDASFNVGRISGGVSVNALPAEAQIEVDLRSIRKGALDSLEQHLRRACQMSAMRKNVTLSVESIGERPSGETPERAAVIQAAIASTRALGLEPDLDVGSTDANIPIAMQVPAVALGGGGSCGNIHTTEEWFDPTARHVGLKRLLLLVCMLAGLKPHVS